MSYYYNTRRIYVSCDCLRASIPFCVRHVCLPTLYRDMRVWIYLENHFGTRYVIVGDIDEFGWLHIDFNQLPIGVLNPYAGIFNVYFTAEGDTRDKRLFFTDNRFAYYCMSLLVDDMRVSELITTMGTECWNLELKPFKCCCDNFSSGICPSFYDFCETPEYITITESGYYGNEIPEEPGCCLGETCCLTCEELNAIANCFATNIARAGAVGVTFGLTTEIFTKWVTLLRVMALEPDFNACPEYLPVSDPITGTIYIGRRDSSRIECMRISRGVNELYPLADNLYVPFGLVLSPVDGQCENEVAFLWLIRTTIAGPADYRFELIGSATCTNTSLYERVSYSERNYMEFYSNCKTC